MIMERTIEKRLPYCFESDINYSDAPNEYDETKYLSASSITLCSLFGENLQIINNTIHISDSYQGDLDDVNTNYGPLGCPDCQVHGSYNGVFFTLCETCAELPDLISDSESDYDNITVVGDITVIGDIDFNNSNSILDISEEEDDHWVIQERYINYPTISNNSEYNDNHIRDMIQNFQMPCSTHIRIDIEPNRNTDSSQTNFIECGVCQNEKPYHAFMTFACGHQFCGDCSISWLRTHQNCPLCRNDVHTVNI